MLRAHGLSRGAAFATVTLLVALTLLAVIASVGLSQAPAGRITIAWDPNPEPTVLGYRVYVGTQSGVYTETYDAGNVTTFAFTNAVAGRRYFLAVAAYAADNLLGPPSNEVSAVAIADSSEGEPTTTAPSPSVFPISR